MARYIGVKCNSTVKTYAEYPVKTKVNKSTWNLSCIVIYLFTQRTRLHETHTVTTTLFVDVAILHNGVPILFIEWDGDQHLRACATFNRSKSSESSPMFRANLFIRQVERDRAKDDFARTKHSCIMIRVANSLIYDFEDARNYRPNVDAVLKMLVEVVAERKDTRMSLKKVNYLCKSDKNVFSFQVESPLYKERDRNYEKAVEYVTHQVLISSCFQKVEKSSSSSSSSSSKCSDSC